MPAHLGLAVEASEYVARRSIAFGRYHLVEAAVDTWEAAEGSLAEGVDTAQVIAVVVDRDHDCRVVEAAARTRHTAAVVEGLGHARRCAPGRTLALGY